jgi:hypothetical protein
LSVVIAKLRRKRSLSLLGYIEDVKSIRNVWSNPEEDKARARAKVDEARIKLSRQRLALARERLEAEIQWRSEKLDVMLMPVTRTVTTVTRRG